MDGDNNCTVVLVTAGSQEEAENIPTALVELKLATCVNILPIHCSIYIWEGKVSKDREWQLIIKTKLSQFPALEAKIQELHSYDVPEIIAIPIVDGSQAYLQWMLNQIAQ
ncbi:divalent-cation tolerance protein CutA [Mastigocoleus testarum]|uniref:Cation tolerance protein CutA n=1 Tax=Mastigocoleus testarum BC008 TaxID=371196 RepID=A0A0V7ZEW8_9CYAN|nr:divalent-cation tolerance protein CutA [Mastigocoleus testarum]KST62950.1 cation tolerance protein CutA [Mastigocoleus testarum BC008]KST63041.1 cation tolerance protein CutA [Mastigocoleus testarum BC008]